MEDAQVQSVSAPLLVQIVVLLYCQPVVSFFNLHLIPVSSVYQIIYPNSVPMLSRIFN